MPAPEYNVNNLAPLFDEFGNNLSDAANCPTRDNNRAARYERENAIRAAHAARQQALLADDTLVQIGGLPVADDDLGAEFESEPFVNAARRDSERDEQEWEWERDRGAA